MEKRKLAKVRAFIDSWFIAGVVIGIAIFCGLKTAKIL